MRSFLEARCLIPWMREQKAGNRPTVIASDLAADPAVLEARGITRLVRCEEHTGAR